MALSSSYLLLIAVSQPVVIDWKNQKYHNKNSQGFSYSYVAIDGPLKTENPSARPVYLMFWSTVYPSAYLWSSICQLHLIVDVSVDRDSKVFLENLPICGYSKEHPAWEAGQPLFKATWHAIG